MCEYLGALLQWTAFFSIFFFNLESQNALPVGRFNILIEDRKQVKLCDRADTACALSVVKDNNYHSTGSD